MRILRLALTFALAAMMISAATANGPPPPTLLWSDDVVTNDIAVSEDGQYVAVVSPGDFGGRIRFYSRGSGTPLWTWTAVDENLESVAISANGDYLAAGGGSGGIRFGHVYYWANARTRTLDPDPTWVSDDLDGPIRERSLHISDDGNYVVAATVSVTTLYYWADARNRADGGQDYTWRLGDGVSFTSLDMSSDGDAVAAGFSGEGWGVAYVKNATSRVGELDEPDWWSQLDGFVADVAVSDDGNYVAAATFSLQATVHYWAGAGSLSGEQDATWYGPGEEVEFTSIDMSCDGDSVFAEADGGVMFWGGAHGLTGKPQDPSWYYFTDTFIFDVAINDAGTYMAAVDFPDTVFFFDGQGNLLWEDLDIYGDKLSMSCDGGTLAVGTPAFGTAYLLDTGYSDSCCGAAVGGVGGVVTTVDKPTLLAPYLALLVLMGGAGIASVFWAKKKRSD